MMNAKSERMDAVETMIAQAKQDLSDRPLSPAVLARVLDALKTLATRRELWSAADFPPPEDGVRQARYMIREDEDHTFALYLNVMRKGNRTPVHNHTTWACIAAIEGTEANFLYRRLDDGSRPGYAEVVAAGKVLLGPGSGIALMPEDIHAVEIEDDEMIRHLHFYGRALETLTERQAFDLDAKTAKPMDIGVKTRRAA
jgi:predicted metal-dependent enzyme (double-stranded beta helix superfamily)